MKGGLLALVCLVALLAVGAQSLGMQSNLQFVEWVLRTNGNWTLNPNWAPPAEPSTIDDALFYTNPAVVVTLNQNRVIRSLEVANGHEIVVTDGAILAINPPTLARPGFFVSATTGLEGQCPSMTVQPLRNQAYCTDCNQFGLIANGGQTQCVFCPAGKVFDATQPSKCRNCPRWQDSDGLGSPCRDCPAGTSSPGGVPCTVCPFPTDSHIGGPCLVCLPTERDYSCGCTAANGVCVSNIAGAFITDPVTLRNRTACQCVSGVDGPGCNIFNGDVRVNPTSFAFVYHHNNTFETVTVAFQPGFSANGGPLVSPLYSWTSFRWLTNPNELLTTFGAAPFGYTPTGFFFEIQLWFKNAGVVIPLQELSVPMRASVPWDRLVTSNPWRLELFFWNTKERRWIQVIRHCVGQINQRSIQLDGGQYGYKNVNTDGTVSWDIYQATGAYAVFLANSSIANINGTAPARLQPNPAIPVGALGNNSPKGNARVPEITTGVSGVLPLPPPVLPGAAPGEPRRRPIENFPSSTSSSATMLSALNASAMLLVALVYLLL